MKKSAFLFLLVFAFFCLGLISCEKSDPVSPQPTPPVFTNQGQWRMVLSGDFKAETIITVDKQWWMHGTIFLLGKNLNVCCAHPCCFDSSVRDLEGDFIDHVNKNESDCAGAGVGEFFGHINYGTGSGTWNCWRFNSKTGGFDEFFGTFTINKIQS